MKQFIAVFKDSDGDILQVATLEAPGTVSALRKAHAWYLKELDARDAMDAEEMMQQVDIEIVHGTPRRIK